MREPEKKNKQGSLMKKRTAPNSGKDYVGSPCPRISKSFLVLFFKKEPFLPHPTAASAKPASAKCPVSVGCSWSKNKYEFCAAPVACSVPLLSLV
jgi:hypothetical protein